MKTTIQDEQVVWFSQHSKVKSCRKFKTKITTVRKMVKSWIHSSVATLEAHKSESGVETKCYEYKRNTIGVLLEWFLTTRTASTTPRISIFTLSLLKIRPVFLMFPNVCLLISRRWKRLLTNGFHHCKLNPEESLSLEYEQNRTNLRYWKIVANEKCIAEITKMSSVKNSFWANHASKQARISLKQKIFEGTNVLKKWFDYIHSFWRTKEEIAKKLPK